MDPLVYGAAAVLPTSGFRRHPLPDAQSENQKLAASIERAVFRHTDGGVRNLNVEVTRNGVLLSGRCSTYYTKQLAQHAAMGLCGNRQVFNRIDVL